MNGYEKMIGGVLESVHDSVRPQFNTGWVGLFGNKIKADFMCKDADGSITCYEVKFQRVRGSVEQKLCYAIEQIKKCHEVPTYVIIGGTGWTRGALDYALDLPSDGMFAGCLTTDDFLNMHNMGVA